MLVINKSDAVVWFCSWLVWLQVQLDSIQFYYHYYHSLNSLTFLIGGKRTVTFRIQRPWRHNCRLIVVFIFFLKKNGKSKSCSYQSSSNWEYCLFKLKFSLFYTIFVRTSTNCTLRHYSRLNVAVRKSLYRTDKLFCGPLTTRSRHEKPTHMIPKEIWTEMEDCISCFKKCFFFYEFLFFICKKSKFVPILYNVFFVLPESTYPSKVGAPCKRVTSPKRLIIPKKKRVVAQWFVGGKRKTLRNGWK